MRSVEKSANIDSGNRSYNELFDENATLKMTVEELSVKLAWYEEQFRLSKVQKFAASSEKTDADQLSLFNEAEKEARPEKEEPEIEEVLVKRSRARKPTGERFSDLPVETIEYGLSEGELVCEECGDTMKKMSKEIRKEVVVIPPQVKIVEHVKYIYTCENCRDNGTRANIKGAVAPEAVIPHSFVSASLLAFIINRKYAEAIPLYRQEQQWQNFGVDISRQNMANWVIKGADLLSLLYEGMKRELLKESYAHADETTMLVLTDPRGKGKTNAYMWLYCSGEFGKPVYLYEYQPSRSGEHPKRFLGGFTGILQTDGFDGYGKVEGVTLMGCFTHARRYYLDALKAIPADAETSKALATQGRKYCDKLFSLERSYRGKNAEERRLLRLEKSKPVLDAFHEWLLANKDKVLPKSALGKAVTYSLNQWNRLVVFLEDGQVELSNSRAERAIKPFVIGRKNHLFSKTPNGARASAICYSIVETAKANGLSPFHYMNYLFETIPALPPGDCEALDKLLPWSDAIPDFCKVPFKK